MSRSGEPGPFAVTALFELFWKLDVKHAQGIIAGFVG